MLSHELLHGVPEVAPLGGAREHPEDSYRSQRGAVLPILYGDKPDKVFVIEKKIMGLH